MIDEETQGDSAASAGAPVNRDSRREPDVIEGEIAARETGEREPPPDRSAGESRAEPHPAPVAAPRTGAHGFLGGALAGLIVSALAAGASYTLLAPRADVSADPNRLSEIETQARQNSDAIAAEAKRESSAVEGLEKRIIALEAGAGAPAPGAADLEKRVAALEAAGAGNGAAGDATERLAEQVKGLQGDVQGARGEIPDLSARLAKLETDTQKTNAASADLAALTAQVDKIEGTLAAPKPETRSPSETASAIATIAEAAEERLRAGEPLGPDLAALQRLGVDAAALAPLQAVVDGAPTNAALAASFSAAAPHVLAATSQEEKGSVTDRFLAHLHNLVRVRDLNETAGDDPAALISQIEAETRRGDIGAALASFNKLPEAARQAAGDWQTLARTRQAADLALQSIRETAIGQLAGGPKP
jgi:hypothetical protein